MAVRAGGRAAITHWQVLERFAGRTATAKPVASLIACRLETGRTHQIRVHLAHVGHPLLGDAVYGPGFKTKAARLPAGGAAGPGGPWQTGPACLSTGASNIRSQGRDWSSDRNCRPISPVYITAWPPADPRRTSKDP